MTHLRVMLAIANHWLKSRGAQLNVRACIDCRFTGIHWTLSEQSKLVYVCWEGSWISVSRKHSESLSELPRKAAADSLFPRQSTSIWSMN